MRIAALVTWLATMTLGGYLLATWLAKGGLRPDGEAASSRFAPPLILGHAGLAIAGLIVWVSYVVTATTGIAWAALAVLAVVATLGSTMFGMWLRAGNARRPRHARAPRHAAEDHFPPPAVLGHGLLATATIGLVLATLIVSIA